MPPEQHPHANQPVLTLGADRAAATSALILLHGRGASAQDILGLAGELDLPANMIALAPQAANSLWYPQRFIAPIAANEPWLSSALTRIQELVTELEQQGVPASRIVLGGFSQGASLASEFILRNPRRWGGLLVFSGGYIGPMDGTKRQPSGSLEGTPAMLGCSDIDPYIPLERFNETGALLEAMGAAVSLKVYPGMDHTINVDEIKRARQVLAAL